MSFNPRNFDDLTIKELAVRRKLENTFGGYCDYYLRNFNLYLDCVRTFDNTGWFHYRWEKRFCLICFVKLVNSFKSAYELILSGYFAESVIITRSIYELIVRIIFIHKFPKRAEELTNKDGRYFNFSQAEKDLGLKYSSMYKIMSEFAHGNKLDIFGELVDLARGTKTGISGGPQFATPQNRLFVVAMNSLMYYLWLALALLPKSLPDFKKKQVFKTMYQTTMDDFEKNYIREYVDRSGKPSSLATHGVDEVLNIIDSLTDW